MEPYGTAIFCDDIRFEQQGTVSLIGCYGGDLIVSGGFPVQLPKLCIFIQLKMPPDTHTGTPILVKVFLPGAKDGAPSFEHLMPPIPSAVLDAIGKPSDDQDIQRMIGLSFPLIYSPFVIQEQGNIKVRLLLGDKIIKIGVLKVMDASTQNAPIPSPTVSPPPS